MYSMIAFGRIYSSRVVLGDRYITTDSSSSGAGENAGEKSKNLHACCAGVGLGWFGVGSGERCFVSWFIVVGSCGDGACELVRRWTIAKLWNYGFPTKSYLCM